MKLRYKRSGGFANITTRADLDLSKMPAKKAVELRKLISQAGVFDLPPASAQQSRIPDDLQHELEIEEDGKRCKIRRNDSECDPQLMKLFDRLQKEGLKKQ